MIKIYNDNYSIEIENAKITSDKPREHGRTSSRNIYGGLSIFGTAIKIYTVKINFFAISTDEKEVLESLWFNKEKVTIVKEDGTELRDFYITEDENFPLDIDYDIYGEEFYFGEIKFER